MNFAHRPDKFARYYAAEKYLENLENIAGSYQRTNIKAHPNPQMFLERMQDFLDMIGNPEKRFTYIHITGTAGKGTVASWVHAELVRAGKRAGLFTSPFVTSSIEKIQVGNELIDPFVFADIVDELKPHVDRALMEGRHGMPSYFELSLAVALRYFVRMKCEYVVLEVGLGGSYDATNIISRPLVTAITNIDLDHMAVLGPRLEDIARDKSGIIKKDSVFFTTEERPALLKIFKEKCSRVGADHHALPVKGLDIGERNRSLTASICRSLGIINAPDRLGSAPKLPARFEIIARKPLVIMDGAHNPSKITSTVRNLIALKRAAKFGRTFALIAISSDKKWKEMLAELLPHLRAVCFTRFSIPGRKCVSPKDMAFEARRSGFKGRVTVRTDPRIGFHEALKNASARDAVLVTGSFYLAGDIRALYCPEDQILEKRTTRAAAVTKSSK